MIEVIGVLFVVLIILASSIKFVHEYEWGVVYRLGRYVRDSGPGLVLIIPIFDALFKTNLRDPEPLVFPFEVVTKDNVRTKIRAKVHFRVCDREKMIRALFATPVTQDEDIIKNALKETIKQAEYSELLSEDGNVKLGRQSKEMMDKPTDSWGTKMIHPYGIDVTEVEITTEIAGKQLETPFLKNNTRHIIEIFVCCALVSLFCFEGAAEDPSSAARYEEHFIFAIFMFLLLGFATTMTILKRDLRFRILLYPLSTYIGFFLLLIDVKSAYGYGWDDFLISITRGVLFPLFAAGWIFILNGAIPFLWSKLKNRFKTKN